MQKAQSHSSAIYIFSITHHLFLKRKQTPLLCALIILEQGERALPRPLPLSSLSEKGLTQSVPSS